MRAYVSRIPLGGGKFAYDQKAEYADRARLHITRLQSRWTVPEYFYHLQPGGHLAALHAHDGSSWFCKTDLSRFFNCITRHRIVRRLKSLGYSFHEAEEFAVVSTVWDNIANQYVLPYGFVQSSLLASIEMDKGAIGQWLRKCTKQGLAVSVYVDDIIISAQDQTALLVGYHELLAACALANLPVNNAKSIAPAKTITAFNIELSDAAALTIEPARLNEMHGAIQASGNGLRSRGIQGYIRSVNPNQAIQTAQLFANLDLG